MEIERKEARTKLERLEKKKRKEKHWEMLKWITSFIEENKVQWEEDRKLERKRKEEEEKLERWRKLTEDQKIDQLRLEEEGKKKLLTPEERKKRRQEESKARCRNWKEWRNGQEETEEDDDVDEQIETEEKEETRMEDDVEEEEELTKMLELGELEAVGLNLDKEQTLCFLCAHVPCLCSLLKAEMKIKALLAKEQGTPSEREPADKPPTDKQEARTEQIENMKSEPQ